MTAVSIVNTVPVTDSPQVGLERREHRYRLYGESMEIRDLETRGPWAVASERSEDATKGPRVSKSRISIGRAV